jgi:HKD family nuclease
MRNDVLKVIANAKDITNTIILTHNIDFIFVQSVVLPALRKCGSPALTVFADESCAELSYQQQAPVLNGLGSLYRVVPVAMKSGFRFHPKAVLLSGIKQATLLIGSGNLTFGGWRENGEVWLRYDTEVDGTGPHAAFRDYLREIVDLITHSKEPVTRDIDEAFDATSRVWATAMEPASGILWRAGQGKSLLRRMRDALGDRKPDHLIVCSPYFDEDAEALTEIAKDFGVHHSTVLVQSGRTNLLQSAADKLGPKFTLKHAIFEHREMVGNEQSKVIREALLHAKFYAFQCGPEVILFAGSANCSRAALTIPGSQGNAELMSSVVLSLEEFDQEFLSEIAIQNLPPQLAVEIQTPTPPQDQDFIRISAARLAAGVIEVSFQCSQGIVIQKAIVDKMPLTPEEVSATWVRFRVTLPRPLTILLIGQKAGKEFFSPLHWIYNEASLSVSARYRSFGDSIRRIGQSREWGIGAWNEVLTELYKHLDYMPKDSTKPRALHPANIGEDQGGSRFTWKDVFSSDYGLPVHSAFSYLPTGMNQQVGGLKNLLLRWFGLDEVESGGSTEPAGDKPTTPPSNGLDDEEPTDIPDAVPPRPPPSPPAPASTIERKRALKLIEQIADRLASEAYLLERPAEMLSADLKVTAVLFRVAVGNGWITEEEFFDATHRIWLPLFFNAAHGYNVGLLELRQLTDTSSEGFENIMRSVELSAAMASWALAVPAIPMNPMHARFSLASALSVARLPWLWQTGEVEDIAKQVAEVLAYASGNVHENLSHIEARWLTIIRRGYALYKFESIVAKMTVGELSALIKRPKVYAGELLWQKPVGFCVASVDCGRTKDNKCNVLQLQRGDVKVPFRGDFLIPLAELAEDGVIDDPRLSMDVRMEIKDMARELRIGLQNLPQ